MKSVLTRKEKKSLQVRALSSLLELTVNSKSTEEIFSQNAIAWNIPTRSEYGKTISQTDIPLLLDNYARRKLVNKYRTVNGYKESHHVYYRANLERLDEIKEEIKKHN
jgi:hypothetical protein